jgi:NTE family protein
MPVADLVLEGGGVKGIGLVGAISVLEERGYEFHRVGGTSAGAIVGALVASGLSGPQLQAVMRGVDYRKFEDPNLLDHFGRVGEIVSVLVNNGIYKGEYLRRWLGEQLAGIQPKSVRTFADLKLDDPGGSLPPDKSYKLVVMTSCVSEGRLIRLPWDYDELNANADEQPVADAVRMSMSIPFFYEPFTFEDRVFVDGGMLSNFPVDVFDRTDGKAPRWPTFGIKLSARPNANQAPQRVDDPIELVKAMIGTMMNFHDQMHLDDPSVVARTIFVDCGQVKATDFDVDEATQDRLYQSGRDAATAFLATWDWDTYLEKYRSGGAAAMASAAATAP